MDRVPSALTRLRAMISVKVKFLSDHLVWVNKLPFYNIRSTEFILYYLEVIQ